jgi:hypothetical protein
LAIAYINGSVKKYIEFFILNNIPMKVFDFFTFIWLPNIKVIEYGNFCDFGEGGGIRFRYVNFNQI